jgi:hypothetical protein
MSRVADNRYTSIPNLADDHAVHEDWPVNQAPNIYPYSQLGIYVKTNYAPPILNNHSASPMTRMARNTQINQLPLGFFSTCPALAGLLTA